MIFFDDSDTATVQHSPALPARIDARTIAGRLAAGAGAAALMLVAVAAAVVVTVAVALP
ncbi:hypothetical protein [Actinoplanes sp. CA-252034]|uniref:hypothetical protein n=1 Tax=Actinoplanes sp. CA-252034 TaxID=3239906 RepID=UPI003D96CFD7